MSSVLTFEDDLLAFGTAGPAIGIWRSTDGTTWDLLSSPGPSFRTGQFGGGAAIETDSGLAVLGNGPAMWTSPDGRDWTRSDLDMNVFSDNAIVADATAFGSGFVAVGRAYYDVSGGSLQRAAAWASDDGMSWTQAPDTPQFRGDRSTEMTSVVVIDNQLIAVGRRGDDAAVWTSNDGRSWEEVTSQSALRGGEDNHGGTVRMNSVIDIEGRALAVGSVGGLAAIWESVDGTEWAVSLLEREDEDGWYELYDVVAAEGLLVTVGSKRFGGGRVWTGQP